MRRRIATAIWVYAPGYITDKLSVDNMTALTGIKLAENSTAGELHVDLASDQQPCTKSLVNLSYGTDVNVPDIVRYYKPVSPGSKEFGLILPANSAALLRLEPTKE